VKNFRSGKYIEIDLTKKEVKLKYIGEEIIKNYLGGKGLGVKLLSDYITRRVNPLSEENVLVISPGLLSGTLMPGTGRIHICSISPLTDRYGESEAGGYFGTYLKRNGYDSLVIRGSCEKPSVILIVGSKISIEPCEEIWGKTISESYDVLKQKYNSNYSILNIGPAGENKVFYASLFSDIRHVAGRNGMGAVLGSKNIKAILVKKVLNKNPNYKKIKEYSLWMNKHVNKNKSWLKQYGTVCATQFFNELGVLPTKNFKEGHIQLSKNINNGFKYGKEGCYYCPVKCKPISGEFKTGGPEYESYVALGSLCGISDDEEIEKLNEECNELGLDSISTGVSLAFAIECCENGLIKKYMADKELKFGNFKMLFEMIQNIAYRKGFGNILANGSLKASIIFKNGTEKYAMQVNGQEIPMHDPRYKPGLGLGYMVSLIGAEHMQNIHDDIVTQYCLEVENLALLGCKVPLKQYDISYNKVKLIALSGIWSCFQNCIIMCSLLPIKIQDLLDIIKEYTSWELTVKDVIDIGKLIMNKIMEFDKKIMGATFNNFLPHRFYERIRNGMNIKLNFDDMSNAEKIYYEYMKWK